MPDRDENPGNESTAYNWTGAGILIVEDDPVSYAFLKELFQQTGADLYHAADGLEAVSQFRKIKNIDLVIMDIQLPEMDGFEATRIIRSLNSNIPVIAQTAFAMSDDKEKMKQAGFDDYVSKPIDINKLACYCQQMADPVENTGSAKAVRCIINSSSSNLHLLWKLKADIVT